MGKLRISTGTKPRSIDPVSPEVRYVEVPVEVVKFVDRVVEVPIERIVERIVEVPVEVEKVVERVVEKEIIVERPIRVEVLVEVPVEVEKVVEINHLVIKYKVPIWAIALIATEAFALLASLIY